MSQATCSVDGCEKRSEKRGWCAMHYRRWQRTGDLGSAEPKRHDPGTIPCEVDGCESPAKSRRLCNKHYLRQWSKGTTDDPEVKEYPTVCVIDDCDSLVMARGWCRKHYLRWRRLGDTGTPPRFVPKTCSVDDCETRAIKRGLCSKHFERWKKRGTTDDPPPRPTECSVDGCERKPQARGWCKPHYKQLTGQGSAHEMKRYALKRGTQVESVNYERILDEHGMLCHICGGEIGSLADLNMDHVIPLARGGTHTYGNIRPSHKGCNQRKHVKLLDELREIIPV